MQYKENLTLSPQLPYISEEDTRMKSGLNVLTSEPHMALFMEEEGYEVYRKIAEQVWRLSAIAKRKII